MSFAEMYDKGQTGDLFPIGYIFTLKRSKKRVDTCTVQDYRFTYNNNGDLVDIRYVVTHKTAGRIVTEYDMVHATIAMRGYPVSYTAQ